MSPSASRRTRPKAAGLQAVEATPVVLDSSCWIEYFADTEHAELFATAIERVEQLVVPVLTIYEVIKKLVREAGDETASAALLLMQRGRLVISI